MAKKRKIVSPQEDVLKSENAEDSVDDTTQSKKKKRKSRGVASFAENEATSAIELKNEADTSSYAERNDSDSVPSDDNSKKKKKKKKKKSQNDDSLLDAASSSSEVKEKVNGLIEKKDDFKRSWSKEHLVKLINQIESHIPKKDNLKFSSRLGKLDWQAISFEECSAEECQEIWRILQSKIRTYRIFKEVLDDARKYIENDNPVLNEDHPEKPHKPLSSYMLFQRDMKDKVLAENPSLKNSIIELSKAIAAKWNSLSAKKQDKYKTKAIKLREEYEEQLKEFYEKHPDVPIPEPKKTKLKPKSKLDDLGFVKPKSPFQLFADSIREKDSEMSPNDLLEKCRLKWNKMSEKKKAAWIETAQKEEMNYQEALKKYQSEHPDYKAPPLKTLISKRDKNILNHVSGKPEKPAGNGYSLYSRECLQNGSLKDIPSKGRLVEISKRWKALSKSERDSYDAKAKKMMDDYKVQYQNYLENLPPEKRVLEIESSQPKKRKPENKDTSANKKTKLTEPERPPESAFELFKERNKNEWNARSGTDIENQAILKWKKLSNVEKKVYAEEVDTLRKSYVAKLSKYLKFCPPEKLEQYVSMIASHNQASGEPVTLSSEESDDD